MVRFAEIQPDEAIVATLLQQLSWSHVHALLPVKDPLARDFYAVMPEKVHALSAQLKRGLTPMQSWQHSASHTALPYSED